LVRLNAWMSVSVVFRLCAFPQLYFESWMRPQYLQDFSIGFSSVHKKRRRFYPATFVRIFWYFSERNISRSSAPCKNEQNRKNTNWVRKRWSEYL